LIELILGWKGGNAYTLIVTYRAVSIALHTPQLRGHAVTGAQNSSPVTT